MNIGFFRNIKEHEDSFGNIYVDEEFLLMCVKLNNMIEDEHGCGIFFPDKYYIEK